MTYGRNVCLMTSYQGPISAGPFEKLEFTYYGHLMPKTSNIPYKYIQPCGQEETWLDSHV